MMRKMNKMMVLRKFFNQFMDSLEVEIVENVPEQEDVCKECAGCRERAITAAHDARHALGRFLK